MKSGRKNLKKASAEDCISLQEGQSIMQVVSLRGSNLIEISKPATLINAANEVRFCTTPQTRPSIHIIDKGEARSNKVMDAKGVKSLALFPAKFQRCFWIKRGNFVIVDEGGREKALESGDKIACIVSQVLFHAQVRCLERSPDWPLSFSNARPEEPKTFQLLPESYHEEVLNSDSEDDDLPPLEANLNRQRPVDLYSDSDSDSDHDS